MSKEKVCPYKKTGDCPDLQKAVKEALKNKRKKKPETRIIPSIVESTGGQSCYKCNKVIPKKIKCVKHTIQERVGMHANDFKTIEIRYACSKCSGLGDKI